MTDENQFPREPGWSNIIRDLCDHLSEMDRKLLFLREIDNAILVQKKPARKLFKLTLNRLAEIIRTPRIHFYLNLGNSFMLFESTSKDSVPDIPIKVLNNDIFKDVFSLILKRSEAEDIGITGIMGSEVLVDIVEVRIGAETFCFGILMVENPFKYPHGTVSLLSKEKDFINGVSKQLAIGLQNELSQTVNMCLNRILRNVFSRDLKPRICFKIMCENISSFFTKEFTLLLIEDTIHVQISVLDEQEDEKWLNIRGSTGEESGLTRLSLYNSVSGLPFTEQEPKEILCNPIEKYPDLYKYYLGRDNNIKAKGNQSELVMPVIFRDNLFAVINLEALQPNRFKLLHVMIMRRLTRRIAPAIYALNMRIKRTDTLHEGFAQQFDLELEMMASQYRHQTKATNSGIRITFDEIEKHAKNKSIDSIIEETKQLQNFFSELLKDQEVFATNISGFAKPKFRSIKELLEGALTMFDLKKLKSESIEMKPIFKQNYQIKCNLMFRDAFYNLINNSIYWVHQRIKNEPDHKGTINISLDKGPESLESQERELNKFCSIVISDNGTGISRDQLENIFEPTFTKREDGTGYGLYFVNEYIQSLKGRVKVESEFGKYFKIEIILQAIPIDL